MSSRAGYSLFEVLIAFAVMTMVLAVVLPGQAEFLKRSTSSSRRADAADVVYSRLSELGVARALALGETSESVGNWILHQRIVPHSGIAFDIDLADVTIEIEDKSGNVLIKATETRVME